MGHSVHNLLTPSVHNLMTLNVHEVLTLYMMSIRQHLSEYPVARGITQVPRKRWSVTGWLLTAYSGLPV